MAWPFDSEEQLDEWVEAFIATYRKPPTTEAEQEDASLASEPAYSAIHLGHAETLWRFIERIVEQRPSEWALGMLAAGPLEDLIGECGEAFIDRIEAAAERDHVFRRTLHGVCNVGANASIWARIERARGTEPDPTDSTAVR